MIDEELKKLIEATAVETRRHFDVVAERLESKMEALAEGVVISNERIDRLDAKVTGLDAKVTGLDAKVTGLDAKVDRLAAQMASDFDDVRSMIKFSHHELDRRLRSLEEVVADLQQRVERLESSTH